MLCVSCWVARTCRLLRVRFKYLHHTAQLHHGLIATSITDSAAIHIQMWYADTAIAAPSSLAQSPDVASTTGTRAPEGFRNDRHAATRLLSGLNSRKCGINRAVTHACWIGRLSSDISASRLSLPLPRDARDCACCVRFLCMVWSPFVTRSKCNNFGSSVSIIQWTSALVARYGSARRQFCDVCPPGCA